MTQENFCKLPFHHNYINYIDNKIKPCCIFSGDETLDQVKELFLKNERPKGCEECWRREDNNIISKRQYYINQYKNLNETSGIRTYDLRLSTTCNLKCVMCGPHLSTKWNEDKDIYEKYNTKINDPIKYSINDFDFSNALEIYFAGGEPFYMKEVHQILEKISKNKFNVEHTKIRINTNGIITENNKIFQLLKKFKKLEFTISLEGSKRVKEYIRFPANWNDFLSGLKIITDITDKPKTVEEVFSCDRSVAFNVTASCLNLPNLFEVFEWANTLEYVYVVNYVEEPLMLNINSLTPNVIDEFLSEHELYNYTFEHLNDISKYVEKNYKFNKSSNQKMKLYLNDLDKRRNIDSKHILPWCWL